MAFFTHIIYFFFDLGFSHSSYIMLHGASAKWRFLVFFVFWGLQERRGRNERNIGRSIERNIMSVSRIAREDLYIERNIGSVSKRRCNRKKATERYYAPPPPPHPTPHPPHPNPPPHPHPQPPPNPSIRVTGVEKKWQVWRKILINAHCQAEKQSIKRVATYDWGLKQC